MQLRCTRFSVLGRSKALFGVLLVVCVCSTNLIAQTIDTSITGVVVDSSGAVIVGARITLLDASGASQQKTQTDQSGQFSLTHLSPGNYVIQVEKDSFQTAKVPVTVAQPGASTLALRVTLKVGEAKEVVSVTGQPDSLTLANSSVAQEFLDSLPGNVSEVQAKQYRDGAVASFDDALSLTPGVFAKPKSGGEEVRLSVRGSGLNVPFGLRGVRMLRNGISLTRADGFINPELADAFNADYIEVYRGADALEFGAATLGGAVNVVSPTGRSQSGLDARAEFGSFGYRRGQVRYGGVTDGGRLDGFLALSGSFADGFRENSKQSAYRISGNSGYRLSPKSEGRLFSRL